MITFRYLGRLGTRQELALVLGDGREIPAVQDLGTGRLFVRDGHGHRHVIEWRWHADQEWWVLDGQEDRRFANLAAVIEHLASLGGEPIPQGKVTAINQIGGELVYASVPSGAGESKGDE